MLLKSTFFFQPFVVLGNLLKFLLYLKVSKINKTKILFPVVYSGVHLHIPFFYTSGCYTKSNKNLAYKIWRNIKTQKLFLNRLFKAW